MNDHFTYSYKKQHHSSVPKTASTNEKLNTGKELSEESHQSNETKPQHNNAPTTTKTTTSSINAPTTNIKNNSIKINSQSVGPIFLLGKNVVNQSHYDIMKRLCKFTREELLYPNTSIQAFLQQSNLEIKEVIEEQIMLPLKEEDPSSSIKRNTSLMTVHRCYVLAKKAEHLSTIGWILNTPCKNCLCCKKPFHLTRWKHHCRDCGNIICQYCMIRGEDYYECFIRCKSCVTTAAATAVPVHALLTDEQLVSVKSGPGSGKSGRNSETSSMMLGISLEYLSEFIHQIHVASLRGLTTKDVCDIFIKPMTKSSQISFCQLQQVQHPQQIQFANVYVCHAWSSLFLETVEAIFDYFHFPKSYEMDNLEGERTHASCSIRSDKSIRDKDTVFLWMDIFSFNQHQTLSTIALDDDDYSQEYFHSLFPFYFQKIPQTLLVLPHWENPLPFKRMWCLWELASSLQQCTDDSHCEKRVDITMSDKELDHFLQELRFDSDTALQRFLSHIDSERSECTETTDLIVLQQTIRTNSGYEQLNTTVLRLLRVWLIKFLLPEHRKLQEVTMEPTQSDAITLNGAKGTKRFSAATHEPLIVSDQIARINILHALARLTHDQEDDTTCEAYYQQLLKDKQQYYGKQHLETLVTMNEFAIFHQDHGKWVLAVPLLKDVVHGRKQQIGSSHPLTLQAMTQLAHIYFSQNYFHEAEELYEDIVAQKKKFYGNDYLHHDLLLLMTQLATIYEKQHRDSSAETLYHQIYLSWKELLGEHHPFTLTAMNHLIMILEKQGKAEAADHLSQELIEQHTKYIHHQDYSETITSMHELAHLYEAEGKFEKAEAFYRILTEKFEELSTQIQPVSPSAPIDSATTHTTPRSTLPVILSVDEPKYEQKMVITMMNHLINTYEQEGKLTSAEETSLKLLEKAKSIFGPNHLQTWIIMNNLAMLYKQQKKYPAAKELLMNLTDHLQSQYGIEEKSHQKKQEKVEKPSEFYTDDHSNPDDQKVIAVLTNENVKVWELLLTCTNNLGAIYENEGGTALAEKYYENAFHRCNDFLLQTTDDHDRQVIGLVKIQCLNHLAQLYEGLGNYDHSESYYQQALQERQQQLGIDHTDTLRTMNNLAVLYTKQQKYIEAERLYEEALKKRRQLLGNQHPHTITSMNNLAICYKYQAKFEDAIKLYREIVQIRRKLYGDKHSDTILAINNLAMILTQLKKDIQPIA